MQLNIRIITEKEYDEAQRIMAQRTNEMAKKGKNYQEINSRLLESTFFLKMLSYT